MRRDDFVLHLTVLPLESVVEVSLYYGESQFPMLDYALFVHGKIRHISDKRGEYLELTDCLIAPHRAALQAETIWEVTQPSWTVELAVKPCIQIRYRD